MEIKIKISPSKVILDFQLYWLSGWLEMAATKLDWSPPVTWWLDLLDASITCMQ